MCENKPYFHPLNRILFVDQHPVICRKNGPLEHGLYCTTNKEGRGRKTEKKNEGFLIGYFAPDYTVYRHINESREQLNIIHITQQSELTRKLIY